VGAKIELNVVGPTVVPVPIHGAYVFVIGAGEKENTVKVKGSWLIFLVGNNASAGYSFRFGPLKRRW